MNTCRYVVYQKGVIWKFKLVAGNGKILCKSTNRYDRKETILNAIKVISGLIKQDPKIVFE